MLTSHVRLAGPQASWLLTAASVSSDATGTSLTLTRPARTNLMTPIYLRQLLPVYHYRGLLLGWRCSTCNKSFRLPIEQATDELAPSAVARDFDEHSCAETLIEEFHHRSKQQAS
jgi:hypothetical protein